MNNEVTISFEDFARMMASVYRHTGFEGDSFREFAETVLKTEGELQAVKSLGKTFWNVEMGVTE